MFDIDHLYLARKNFDQNASDQFEEGSSKALQNNIISDIITVLTDNKSYNILYKSIDNDTSLVQSIADEIPDEGNTKSVAYNLGTLHEQTTRKNDYITGKVGIGPFALNVTNHILTTLYGVRFKSNAFTEMTGITGFDTILDEDNNQISSWLSAFINAHVDIVKDPYISKLNVNSFTYNMINLLARNGKGKQGLYFLCQPIVRMMAKADNDSKSQFTRDPKQYASAAKMRDAEIEKMFDSITGVKFDKSQLDAIIKDKSPLSLSRKANIVNDVLKSSMLAEIAKNPSLVYTDQKYKEFQYKAYLAWKILEKYSNALNSLVQYTKIDTRKQGKNFIEMQSYSNGYHELVDKDQDEAIFDMETIRNLVEKTWIDQKTRDAIEEPMRVMSGQSFQGTKQFMNKVEALATTFSTKFGDRETNLLRNNKVLKKLSQAASGQIKVNYAIRLAKDLGIDVKGLFDGDKTIYDRLNAIQFCIELNRFDMGRLKDNYLINHLKPGNAPQDAWVNGQRVKAPKFIEVINGMDEDKMSSDMFIESWEELLNDQNQNVRNFARDLIYYALITSGDTKGFNKLAKYIPVSWMITKQSENLPSFAEYIKDQLDNPYVNQDLIAENLFMDSDVIGRASFKDFIYANNGNYAPAIIIANELMQNPSDYVSVRYDGSKYNDSQSYTLYKYVGMSNIVYKQVSTDEKTGKKIERQYSEQRQVYAIIPKRGYQEKGGLNIYEYGNIGLNINGIAMSDDIIEQQQNKLSNFLMRNINIDEQNPNDALNWLTMKYYDPNSTFDDAVQQTQTEAVEQPKFSDVGDSPTGQKVYVARQYYYKGLPQKHPDVQYIFTENAQAYAYSQNFKGASPCLINVSAGHKGSNQACIRTDQNGNISPNAIGLVVKLAQQNTNGKWLAQDGCFTQDNDQWFNYFKSYVDHALNRIDKSKPIVFPGGIATGKAALPKRFAEYIQQRLISDFNIATQIVANNTPGYSGYGLNVLGVVSNEDKIATLDQHALQHKTSNTLAENDNKKEISRISGLLDLLNNNGININTPNRINVSDYDSKYISEKLIIKDKIFNDVVKLAKFRQKFKQAGYVESYTTIPFSQYKVIEQKLQESGIVSSGVLKGSNSIFEMVTDVYNYLDDDEGTLQDLLRNKLFKYNKNANTITVPQFIIDINDFISEKIVDLVKEQDGFSRIGIDDVIETVITIKDAIDFQYGDSRQTDFLKELGMSDEDIEEAKRIKNNCKGGK